MDLEFVSAGLLHHGLEQLANFVEGRWKHVLCRFGSGLPQQFGKIVAWL